MLLLKDDVTRHYAGPALDVAVRLLVEGGRCYTTSTLGSSYADREEIDLDQALVLAEAMGRRVEVIERLLEQLRYAERAAQEKRLERAEKAAEAHVGAMEAECALAVFTERMRVHGVEGMGS